MAFTGILGSSSSQLGNIELGQEPGPATEIFRSVTNTLVLSQSATTTSSSQKLIVQGLTTTHSLSRNTVSNKPVTTSLSLAQSVTVLVAKRAENTIVFAQSVSVETGKYFTQSIGLGFALTYTGTYGKPALSYFQYGQSLSLTKTLNLSASNSLSFSQAALAPSVKSGENTLIFSQSAVLVQSKPATNVLALTSTVRIQLTKNVLITSRLRWSQAVVRRLSKTYRVSNAIGFNGFVKKWKVFDLTPTNTLTLTHDNVRERFNRSITSALVLSQTATSQKVISRNVPHALSLSQIAARVTTINRSVSNTLVYLNNRSIYVPLANMGDVLIPNLIQVQIKGFSGPRPRRIYPHCVLEVPERAITLPAPEFNDFDAYGGMFTIRRSMNGGTITYVHRLDTSTLKYDFVIGERKSLELEDYLLNFNSRIHTLTNWRGERWYVFITNNPMELVARSRYTNNLNDSFDDREKHTVTLEFEGTRIN